jgi:hypothetical protein
MPAPHSVTILQNSVFEEIIKGPGMVVHTYNPTSSAVRIGRM